MAKRVFAYTNASWTATAHGSVATNNNYMCVRGPTTSGTLVVCDTLEILISGNASASIIGGFVYAYSSTLGATPTALAAPGSDGAMMLNASALANVMITYFTATTAPTPSNAATLAKLNLGLNLFGGIIRWNAAPTQQWTQVGNAANGGESILFNCSTFQGASAGAASAHIIYEPY